MQKLTFVLCMGLLVAALSFVHVAESHKVILDKAEANAFLKKDSDLRVKRYYEEEEDAEGTVPAVCLACICQVESNCKDIGCIWDVNSYSCGAYQIKNPYWIDCGSLGSSWRTCANDRSCAEKCVHAYMDRYAARCASNSNPTCETYARVHNGGPNGCQSSSTLSYWSRVQDCLKNQ